jgi:hypothetical protein
MGCPTKVQLIKRKQSEQWYINFPSTIAQAMDFLKGEIMHWHIEDKETLVLKRPNAPPRLLKKKLQTSTTHSTNSGTEPGAPSPIGVPGTEADD